MLSPKTPRSRLRLYAAAWAAAVAAVPAYVAAGTEGIADVFIVPGRIPLTLVAILAAGISGYWIGWRLIDPNGDHIILGGVFLGAVICLFAYYLLGVLVAVLITSGIAAGLVLLVVLLCVGGTTLRWAATPVMLLRADTLISILISA